MLSSRIVLIETALASIATVGPGFIDQVNDFPAVALLRPSVSRQHISSRASIDRFSFIVRGYVLTDEDSIESSEDLGEGD